MWSCFVSGGFIVFPLNNHIFRARQYVGRGHLVANCLQQDFENEFFQNRKKILKILMKINFLSKQNLCLNY